MIHFLDAANHALFFYYLLSNVAYLIMLAIALRTSAAHLRHLESIRFDWMKGSPMVPPITVLVPAHNEEKSICTALRNLLDLDYPELELIVINDGSADNTLQMMQREFRLRLVKAVYVPQVVSGSVRGLYRSDVDPRLLVIDKESIGSKAGGSYAVKEGEKTGCPFPTKSVAHWSPTFDGVDLTLTSATSLLVSVRLIIRSVSQA